MRNHKTGTSKLYKILKSITESNRGITTSHATIGASNSIPTYTKQTDIFIDHYENISHIKPLHSDRVTESDRDRVKDTLLDVQFTTLQTIP